MSSSHSKAPVSVSQPYSPLVLELLHNRGVRTEDEIERFLHPHYEEGLHDPFLMTDMERAVTRIIRALDTNEHIVIYSDYDCDGIPGGVLLHDFFTEIGYQHFENYIPHRHEEGYGFNEGAVDTLKEKGATLIITVDCGSTDVRATEKAQDAGMDVIITDHHELGRTQPPAYALLNPKRDDAYPFPELCGSGVAFKLVQGLIARGTFNLKSGWEKWWLDMVGIATIADMVPLVGENRVLAHYGLHVLRKSKRPGVQHLVRSMRLQQQHLTEDDIGFMIGPRINAASRMDTPEDAFHVLATRDEADAGTRVRHLEKLNNERKGVVAAMVKDVKTRLAKMNQLQPVIVIGNPVWRPALVGLAANALVEEYKRPVFIWGRDGRNIIKGSCRSDGHASVVSLMHEVNDVLLEYGGHHASGGFAVTSDGIHVLDDRINTAYATLYSALDTSDGAPEVIIDADLTLNDITPALVRDIQMLAPFGEGNPKPLFRFCRVVPTQVTTFGKGNEHTKLIFNTRGGSLEAIAFFRMPEQFTVTPHEGSSMTLIAHVEKAFFMNRLQIRLRVVDIVEM